MTWNDEDDLGGEDQLSPRQLAAVTRYRGRQGRYQRERLNPSTRDAWAMFDINEQHIENRNIWKGGNR